MEEPDLQDDHHLGSYAMVGNDLTEPRMALRQQPQPEEPQEDPDYIIVNREIQETPPAPPELQEIQESAVGEITTSLESLAIAARAVRVLNLGPQWGAARYPQIFGITTREFPYGEHIWGQLRRMLYD